MTSAIRPHFATNWILLNAFYDFSKTYVFLSDTRSRLVKSSLSVYLYNGFATQTIRISIAKDNAANNNGLSNL